MNGRIGTTNTSANAQNEPLFQPPTTAQAAANQLPAGDGLALALQTTLHSCASTKARQMWIDAGYLRAQTPEQRSSVDRLAEMFGATPHPVEETVTTRPIRDRVDTKPKSNVLRRMTKNSVHKSTSSTATATRKPSAKSVAQQQIGKLSDEWKYSRDIGAALGQGSAQTEERMRALGTLNRAEVYQSLAKEFNSPADTANVLRQLDKAIPERFVQVVGNQVRQILDRGDAQLAELAKSKTARSTWMNQLGSVDARTSAITKLGVDEDDAREIATDPQENDDELLGTINKARYYIGCMQHSAAVASFEPDTALSLLEKYPVVANAVKSSIDMKPNSYLASSIEQLRTDAQSQRSIKQAAWKGLGIAQSIITDGFTGGITAGMGLLGKAGVSGAISSGTSTLGNTVQLLSAHYGVKQAQIAFGQNLSTQDTVDAAKQRLSDAKTTLVVEAVAAFVGSGATSAVRGYYTAGRAAAAMSKIPKTEMLGNLAESVVAATGPTAATEAVNKLRQ